MTETIGATMFCCPPPRVFLAMACMLVIAGHAAAHEGHHRPDATQPVADFQFDAADAAIPATMLDNPSFYDGDVVSYAGQLWYACLEFVPGKGDRIRVARHDVSGEWSGNGVIDQLSEVAAPTLTVDGKGRLWLSYEARQADSWDVYLVQLVDGKPATAPGRVSRGDGASIHHRTSATVDGLWIVWQADRHGQFDIVARRMIDGVLQDIHTVSDNPRGDWHPSIAVDRRGQVHIVWDSFVDGTFDVYLRSYRRGAWGEKIAIATSPAFEARTDIVIDSHDRAWIVWEEGGENWGRPYRGIDTTTIRDQHGPLHRFRSIRIAVVDADGTTHSLADPLPMPALEQARRRTGRPPGVEQTGAFYERTKLAVDRAGHVWLVYRHFYTPWLGVTHRSHVQQAWGVFARCTTDGRWSPLYRLSIGQGDGLQRLEVATHKDGIVVLWTTGRTDRKADDRPRGLATATLSAS
ncbi:MAG: TolB family protein, partial [Pirellulales bacterium]